MRRKKFGESLGHPDREAVQVKVIVIAVLANHSQAASEARQSIVSTPPARTRRARPARSSNLTRRRRISQNSP
jgi:hypothetical protein